MGPKRVPPSVTLTCTVLATLCRLLVLLTLLFTQHAARAQNDPYANVSYDYVNLGAPKFINANAIDVGKVQQVTKFRSDAGHDYSDSTEFYGGIGLIDPITGKLESCRSMKHYFYGVDQSTGLYSPVAGTITGIEPNTYGDVQIGIQPDAQPAFGINIFHVLLEGTFTVGEHLTEGQRLGHSPDPSLYPAQDVALFVKTPGGFHLISYFEALTDTAFAPWQARGLVSASAISYTAAQRDAAPYECYPGGSITFEYGTASTPDPTLDYLTLTGGAATQTVTVAPLPTFIRTTDPPFTVAASASSGLAVTLTSQTPSICTTQGLVITAVAAGSCQLEATQAGNANLHVGEAFADTFIIAGAYAGPLYSSAQSAVQSFLRFSNTGASAGNVTVTLYNADTGQSLGQWTQSNLAPDAEVQVPIATLESAILAPGTAKPDYYTAAVQAGFSGTLQHVLWRPSTGVLTNLSTCPFGTGADPTTLTAVHTSLLAAAGYPSSIVVNNLGAAGTVVLDIFDARNGAKLGSYTTPAIAAGGSLAVKVSDMEAAANIAPTVGMAHYTVKAENFTGFLQHLVNNTAVGVTTDMTTSCTLDSSTPAGVATSQGNVQTSLVTSSANGTQQSYVRLWNVGSSSTSTVTVTLNDPGTGLALGTWTSPAIAYNVALQFPIATLESALPAGTPKPAAYTLSMQANAGFSGYFQYVAWNVGEGTLTNLTSCSSGISLNASEMAFVHSSLLSNSYPSQLAVSNYGATAASWPLNYYDANTGTDVSEPYSPYYVGTPGRGGVAIAANGSTLVDVAASEQLTNFVPTAGQYYFVAGFTVGGYANLPQYAQNLVTNQQSGVVENMTNTCTLY